MPAQYIKSVIKTVPDYPKPGIMFRDVTTLFADPRGLRMAIDQMLHPYAGERIDKVVGLEARGFILGGAIAHQLSVGFVPIRKKGKLPGTTISEEYKLEYGEAIVEIHDDAIRRRLAESREDRVIGADQRHDGVFPIVIDLDV